MAVLVSRRRGQAPPPWVVFEALVESELVWFDVRRGERRPMVLEQNRPDLVVWSSIWKDQPDLQVRFDLEPDGDGSMLTWTLLAPDGSHAELGDEDVQRRRYRLNQLINGQMRDAFG